MKRSTFLLFLALLWVALVPVPSASQQTDAPAKAGASTGVEAPVLPSNPTAAVPGATAAGAALATVSPEALRSVAALAGGGVQPKDVRPSPVAGIFEVRRANDIIYMSQDGRWVFTGDLYNVATRVNVTEARRADLRKQLIDAVPESDMVVFSPAQVKYTITVFTDVDCPYCRALHSQIAQYNNLGIKVRYVFFPRSGPDTDSWHKAEQIWCSADRKAALTDAKLGKRLEAKVCANNPVAQEYELGREIGLEGTPGIVTANGTMIGGYLPPNQLVEQLKQQP
jgi:thiol:disulfide interchange protein DsbC